MMRKKAKATTVAAVLVLAVILVWIKAAHFVTIERPLEHCRVLSAYHLTVDARGAQIEQSWIYEKDTLPYTDIAQALEQTYFITDHIGGSSDGDARNELTIAFGETMEGLPDIRVTVSENGYIQMNGKRVYPLSLQYAGNRLYGYLLECLQEGTGEQQ